MNKTDLVFYLSVIGMVWLKVGDQVHALVSGNIFAWLSIFFAAIAVIAFEMYEKINGSQPTPPQP